MLLRHGATPSFIEFKNSSNVTVASINTNGDINVSGSFKVNGSSVGGSSISTLDDLTDVVTAGAANGQALVYNGASWAPGSISVSSAGRTTEGIVYGQMSSMIDTVFLGYNSGSSVVSGYRNIAIGNSALSMISGGNENVAIGYYALSNNSSGSNNIAIGSMTGGANTSGYNNIFIGNGAGYYETGSNTLYIANSNTSSPLIKGDFSNATVDINGSLTYRQAFNNQGSNTMVYLTSSDKGKVVTFNTSSNVTVYVNSFANLVAGERVDLLNLGTGTVSISGAGVTVNGTPGLKLRAQYSAASLLCTQSNMSYVLIGDLAA